MAHCPNCNTYLATFRNSDGIYYYCEQCSGRAVTIPLLRLTVGDRFISPMVRLINTTKEISARTCPFCTFPMKVIQLAQPPLALESCKTCSMVWFDAGTFEQLPVGTVDSPEEALARALEAETKWKMEQQQRHGGRFVYGEMPKEKWKWIPAFLGMPIKHDRTDISKWPWALWSLSAIVTLTSFIGFFHERAAVETFGMIPSEAWRYGGLTMLTSFFIHAGIFHLFSNLYFFLLFGGEVENFLGRWRFLALIFLATVVGCSLHAAFNLDSTIPMIGASGGISGVLVFYALQFPKARLAFLFVFFWVRFFWIQIPAWAVFIVWLLLQFREAYLQHIGFSNVAALGHIGGVLTGFVLWWFWRKLPQKTDAEADSVENT